MKYDMFYLQSCALLVLLQKSSFKRHILVLMFWFECLVQSHEGCLNMSAIEAQVKEFIVERHQIDRLTRSTSCCSGLRLHGNTGLCTVTYQSVQVHFFILLKLILVSLIFKTNKTENKEYMDVRLKHPPLRNRLFPYQIRFSGE